MNALANSQYEELSKFLEKGYPEADSPVRFARYTGQEKGEAREALRRDPPDILLTNYMMLELLLTRAEDRQLVRAAQGLRFLVFDELHTYRGRQGADVALLIRRCRQAFDGRATICIGTSATMASGGSMDEQRKEVARVAQSLFGVEFTPEQVIAETLERATRAIDLSDGRAIETIKASIALNQDPPSDYEAFRQHPLASWIESTFGIREERGSNQLVRQVPRRLTGEPIEGHESAAAELADLTGTQPDECAVVLRHFLLKGASLRRSESSRFPIFAFRLHQFFTRGDTVWATMEPELARHLELAKKAAKPGEPEKRLFPLTFCRHCGTAYYRVKVVQDEHGKSSAPLVKIAANGAMTGTRMRMSTCPSMRPGREPRGPRCSIVCPTSLRRRLRKDSSVYAPTRGRCAGVRIFADATGRIVSEGQGIPVALIRKNFLFCLEPSCGVAYTRSQRSERNKLATLGVDSRSTATTILAVRALLELQQDRDLTPEARKLLSFTDNRQDASLQAGHFNDFVQVALLRSALHKATQARGSSGLAHGDLSRSIFDAMQLRFDEYAADPEVRGPARTATHDALRRVIDYYLYRDLQRGWRVTAPNLEDCGLLHFEYEGLRGPDGLLGETALWNDRLHA